MTTASAAARPVSARERLLTRAYLHLLGAVLGFVALETWLFRSGWAETIARTVAGVNWLLVLGAFMIVAWFAARVAHRVRSRPAQYAALALFVTAEALLFVPLLFWADRLAPGTIRSAAAVSVAGFLGLTAIVHWTRRDFSFLRPFLYWGGLVAFALIVVAVLTRFTLGPLFSIAMIGYAGAAILYDTSKVMRRYPPDRDVAAALELFSSAALLFWYVLRFMRRR